MCFYVCVFLFVCLNVCVFLCVCVCFVCLCFSVCIFIFVFCSFVSVCIFVLVVGLEVEQVFTQLECGWVEEGDACPLDYDPH